MLNVNCNDIDDQSFDSSTQINLLTCVLTLRSTTYRTNQLIVIDMQFDTQINNLSFESSQINMTYRILDLMSTRDDETFICDQIS